MKSSPPPNTRSESHLRVCGAGDRVEQDAEHDAEEEQAAVAALVLLLALHAVGRLAQLGDRRAQLVLDVLVGGDARRDAGHAAVADQLVVDRACRLVRVPHVVAQLVVVERAIDIRFDGARPRPRPCLSSWPFVGGSFRLLARAVYPSRSFVILAACGGSTEAAGGGSHGRRRAAPGFRFAVPAGWTVRTRRRAPSPRQGGGARSR